MMIMWHSLKSGLGTQDLGPVTRDPGLTIRDPRPKTSRSITQDTEPGTSGPILIT